MVLEFRVSISTTQYRYNLCQILDLIGVQYVCIFISFESPLTQILVKSGLGFVGGGKAFFFSLRFFSETPLKLLYEHENFFG